jgi:hypothetical protein
MFNDYGPTETTVCATIIAPLCDAMAPLIGLPRWRSSASWQKQASMPA